MSALVSAVKKRVRTVPQALAALAAMERELTTAKTYDDLRRIEQAAAALKLLLGHVGEVKAKAEDTILLVNRRIGEELAKVPKAGGPGRGKRTRASAKSLGREATGINASARSRLGKLAARPVEEVKATATKLRKEGKDATVNAVVKEMTQGDKKGRRAAKEQELGQRQRALPQRRYGVIYADPEWKFEVWSENGQDRAAANHYATSATKVIAERDVPSIAAKDCVLFLWATAPMIEAALIVMREWGFDYKSQFIWNKPKVGTGYWNRNKHEVLLVGTKGNIPAPAPGTQWDSVIDAPLGRHSEKPEVFAEMIEAYFPTLPKIELNRRGPPRDNWSAWGAEAEINSPAITDEDQLATAGG